MSNLERAVKKVAAATDINDHTGAIVIMAQYAAKKHNQLEGVDSLIKSAKAVVQLQEFYGHMPQYLNQIRNEVCLRVESFLNAEETKAFHAAR